MPRITKPLSDTEIRKSKIKEKTYKLSDGNGLYLVVKNNGTKFFRYDYIFYKKRKSMSLGIYPDTSLKQAREKREQMKNLLNNNLDPIENKKQKLDGQSITFMYVSEKWINLMKNEWKEITLNKTKSRLTQHVYPYIGKKDFRDITRIDILNILDRMQGNNLFDITARILNTIERIYKYAVTYGICEHNIIADIDKRSVLKNKETIHHPALTKEEDIKKLMQDIISYEKTYSGDISTIYALKILPYTFLRSYNLRYLEWEEVDLIEKKIYITAKKMKNKKDFLLPLSNQAVDILLSIKPYSFNMSKFVFPSPISHLKTISENTLNHALMKLGYKNLMTTHGFRAMFSTIAHEKVNIHGFNSDIIESCLAHAERNKVKAAYNRENKMKYYEEKKELLQWWADWLNHIH